MAMFVPHWGALNMAIYLYEAGREATLLPQLPLYGTQLRQLSYRNYLPQYLRRKFRLRFVALQWKQQSDVLLELGPIP